MNEIDNHQGQPSSDRRNDHQTQQNNQNPQSFQNNDPVNQTSQPTMNSHKTYSKSSQRYRMANFDDQSPGHEEKDQNVANFDFLQATEQKVIEKEHDHVESRNDIILKADMYQKSGETKGRNLANIADDLPDQFAKSQKVRHEIADESSLNALMNFEQYTDIEKNQFEKQGIPPSIIDNIGFMDDEEEIQPIKTALTEEQCQLVTDSWNQLISMYNMQKFGGILFKQLFRISPETLQLFPFKDLPKGRMFKSDVFKKHVLNVTKSIDAAIGRIHILQGDVDLKELGKRHIKYGVKEEDYPVISQAIIQTMQMGLQDKFTPDLKEAWIKTCKIVSQSMISNNYQIESSNSNDQLKAADFDENKIRLIQQSWLYIQQQGLQEFGVSLFKKIFLLSPELIQFFPFKNEQNLMSSQKFMEHTLKVATALAAAVENIEDLENLTPHLKQLGLRHKKYGVVKEHYPMILHALIQTLQDCLDNQFTPELKNAWTVVGNLVAETMISDHYSSLNLSEIDSMQKSADSKNIKKEAKIIQIEEDSNNDSDMSIEIQQDNHDNSQVENSHLNISQSMRLDESNYPLQPIAHHDTEDSVQTLSEKSASNMSEFQKSKQTIMGKEGLSQEIKKKIQDHYISIFRKEVDFHHKVAYRFEKAYRLSKKTSERRQTLNLEIIDCISEHSGYIEQDPMTLFYCLYFCIYYNNADLVEFVRTLIKSIPHIDKIHKLLEYIDLNGVSKIRQKGSPINSLIYHMVFYQAMDDHLRIIYSKIITQLRLIQLRDKDALTLINTRDYELINLCLEKHVAKLNLTLFFKESFPLKAQTYRKYSQAYFEEIVINNDVEARCAQNFRERFLVTAEDIYTVFQMYCKEDYHEQFINTKKNDITPKQFRELFIICLRNDSIRVAMLIYTLYLNEEVEMDQKMMEIVMQSIKDSQYFHEFKLFFIHQHFDVLTIQQLDRLIDIYQQVVHEKEIQLNAMPNQYNVIKISLLIYRICWKVEKKQIYSLITKCQLLQNFLVKSLMKYFKLQNNILTLHKFMTEPIFHKSERKDCLDIMLEMDMKELLQHPIVIEVLNLVYEGKYSASNSSLSMSQTYQCLVEMDTFSLKNILSRLVQNILLFGDGTNSRQTNLQYNIWKQSIQQREQDEMILSVIVATLLIFTSFLIILELITDSNISNQFFSSYIVHDPKQLEQASEVIKIEFCNLFMPQLQKQFSVIQILLIQVALMTVGLSSSICQMVATFRLKDNMTLNHFHLTIQLALVIVGIIFTSRVLAKSNVNHAITSQCIPYVNLDQNQIMNVNQVLYLFNTQSGEISFNFVISAIIVLSTIISIIMLQRTKQMGELLMMGNQMIIELFKFFATFGFYLMITIMLGVFLKQMYRNELFDDHRVFLDLFNAFNGIADYSQFTMPIGQSYIAIFMYCVRILFISLLASMFINRYRQLWANIDAHRYLRIIQLKNQVSYDKHVGCITLSFFPLNIMIIPLIPLIIKLRSPRISDFLLKIQYSIMMLFYSILALFMIFPLAPLLYCKLLINSFFIAMNSNRQKYKGQNLVKLLQAIFFGLPLILLSIIVDFLQLPIYLFTPSKSFEHKYQMSQDRLDDTQLNRLIPVAVMIFYGQYWQNFQGQSKSLVELMHMHRRKMHLVDYMHDFFCIGSKDYKQALANIQDYNGTKILTSKSCIPSTCGEFKKSKVHLNMFWAVQIDIERYNYVDIMFRKNRMGILKQEIQQAEESKITIKRTKFEQACTDLVLGEKADDVQLGELQEETGYVDGAYATGLGPDGALLKRNNTDFMNNFFITIAVRSFTDIDNQIHENKGSGQGKRSDKFQKLMNWSKEIWNKQIVNAHKDTCDKYVNLVHQQVDQQIQIDSSFRSSITQTNENSNENILPIKK